MSGRGFYSFAQRASFCAGDQALPLPFMARTASVPMEMLHRCPFEPLRRGFYLLAPSVAFALNGELFRGLASCWTLQTLSSFLASAPSMRLQAPGSFACGVTGTERALAMATFTREGKTTALGKAVERSLS